MEEPPDGLMNSVDLGPEGFFVRGEGLESLLEFRCRPFLSVFDAPWPSASRLGFSGLRHLTAWQGC